MDSQLIISVSGLRGVVGESLTSAVAARYAAAFAAHAPPGELAVGRDGRATGVELAREVRRALSDCGRDVVDAGVVATPTLGVLVRTLGLAGAIQVTASHNPPEYNGMKLFDADGRVVGASVGADIKRGYESGERPAADGRPGATRSCEDPHATHLRSVLETVDIERIRRRGYRVLLDVNGGAGGGLGVRLLETLGCQVVALGGEPTGQFRHPPEPTEENLRDVGRRVVQQAAAVGFCQDPDADRLAVIDERGRYVGEECTLALCLEHRLASRVGPVVVNCATSRMCQDIAARYGGEFHRSAVGEANVADLMIRVQAVYGGEGNGGPIDPRVGYVRDSFVGMAQILDAMSAREATAGQLADVLPRYAIVKRKAPLEADCVAAALKVLAAHFDDARPDDGDGLRLDWPDRWLLIRASNTEPIVRLIAEAASRTEAEALCREAAEVLARRG